MIGNIHASSVILGLPIRTKPLRIVDLGSKCTELPASEDDAKDSHCRGRIFYQDTLASLSYVANVAAQKDQLSANKRVEQQHKAHGPSRYHEEMRINAANIRPIVRVISDKWLVFLDISRWVTR